MLDEEIAELEEDLAIASMWADEASDEEGEDGAGTAATKAMSSRSMNRIGGTQWGIMTVEGLSLDGYSSKVIGGGGREGGREGGRLFYSPPLALIPSTACIPTTTTHAGAHHVTYITTL